MNPVYEIIVKMRTPDGFIDVVFFSLGTNPDLALSTFNSLRGDPNDNHDAIIRLCLVEKSEKTAPKQLKSIGCILNAFAENSKIIARDVFKFNNLEK